MNYEEEIDESASQAINEQNEKSYVAVVKKAIIYFIENKISLDLLDSIGARYLPYMKISGKYEHVLTTISSLETLKDPKKIAKKCLIQLNKLSDENEKAV